MDREGCLEDTLVWGSLMEDFAPRSDERGVGRSATKKIGLKRDCGL
jgi:hypothetical protein